MVKRQLAPLPGATTLPSYRQVFLLFRTCQLQLSLPALARSLL